MAESLFSFSRTVSCLSSFYKLCSSSYQRSIILSPLVESLDLQTSFISSGHSEICSNCMKKRNFVQIPKVAQSSLFSILTFSCGAHRLADKTDTEHFVTDNLARWESLVEEAKLTSDEKKIHGRHLDAIWDGKKFYTDPRSGYRVITRLVHLQRGDCCGNGCRHCPYGHCNVSMHKRKKRYNSAFYV